jgi:hypothetical protein
VKINVKNIYHENKISWDNFCVEEVNIYCGRPTKLMPLISPLANPFKMKCKSDATAEEKEAERLQVIEFYRRLLWEEIRDKRDNGVTSERLATLLKIVDWLKQDKTINLYCYCSPKPCHCDVIKSCLEYLHKQELNLCK